MNHMLDVAVYQLGSDQPFFTIYADNFSPTYWWMKQIIIADYFGCSPDDVASHEDDDGAELITVAGKVVGSFNQPVCLEQT